MNGKAVLHRHVTDEASAKRSELNRQLHTTYVGAKQRETETAVHGCHCLGYMALGVDLMVARPWVVVHVSLALKFVS